MGEEGQLRDSGDAIGDDTVLVVSPPPGHVAFKHVESDSSSEDDEDDDMGSGGGAAEGSA